MKYAYLASIFVGAFALTIAVGTSRLLPVNTTQNISSKSNVLGESTVNTCGIQFKDLMPKAAGSVTIAETGSYSLWVRAKIEQSNGGSLLLSVDDGCPVVMGGDATHFPKGNWVWVGREYDSVVVSPYVRILKSGIHSVTLGSNAQTVAIDRVLFTLDRECTPVGMGENCATSGVMATPTPEL